MYLSQPNSIQDYEKQTLIEKISKRKTDDTSKHSSHT